MSEFTFVPMSDMTTEQVKEAEKLDVLDTYEQGEGVLVDNKTAKKIGLDIRLSNESAKCLKRCDRLLGEFSSLHMKELYKEGVRAGIFERYYTRAEQVKTAIQQNSEASVFISVRRELTRLENALRVSKK